MNFPETVKLLNRFQDQIKFNEDIRDMEIEALIKSREIESCQITVQQIEDRLRVKPSRVEGLAKHFKTTASSIKTLIAGSERIKRGDAAWLRVWKQNGNPLSFRSK